MEFTVGAPNCLQEKLIVMFRKRLRHPIQIHSLVDLHRSVVMYHSRIQGEVGRSRFRCLRQVGTSVLRSLRFHATVLSWTVGSIILLSSIGGHDRLRHCSLQSTCCTCTGAGAGNLRGVAIKPGISGMPYRCTQSPWCAASKCHLTMLLLEDWWHIIRHIAEAIYGSCILNLLPCCASHVLQRVLKPPELKIHMPVDPKKLRRLYHEVVSAVDQKRAAIRDKTLISPHK